MEGREIALRLAVCAKSGIYTMPPPIARPFLPQLVLEKAVTETHCFRFLGKGLSISSVAPVSVATFA